MSMKYSSTILRAAVFVLLCAGWASAAVEVAVSAQKYAARPGDVFPVIYTVSWEGGPGAYTVLPPQLPALDWGAAELIEMRTRRHGDRHETQLTVGYLAAERGVYMAPPLQLRVIAWDGEFSEQIMALDEAVPTQVFEAPAVTVVMRASRAGIWAAVSVALLLIASVAVWQGMRRRRQAATIDETLPPAEQARALLHEARRHRLDGDYYAFYRALLRALDCIEPDVPESVGVLQSKLKQAADDTGYRGARPADDALEGDFKDVERIVAQALQRAVKES